MSGPDVSRARRTPVAEAAPIDGRRHDYADAFELRLAEPDTHTAEEWARACLEQSPAAVRWIIRVAHRHVLRLRLGPMSSPAHVHGWRIVESEPDVIRLEAESPLLGRGVIVGRRHSPTNVEVTTFLFYDRPALAGALWSAVGPLHRRIAPALLNHAAAGFARLSRA